MYAVYPLLSVAALAIRASAAPGAPSPVALVPRATPAAEKAEDRFYVGVPQISSNVYMSDNVPKPEEVYVTEGGQCFIYSACGLYGVALKEQLTKTLTAAAATDDVAYDAEHERIFQKHYMGSVSSNGPGSTAIYLQDDMRNNDLSGLKEYWRWTIWSLSQEGIADDKPCYEFSINPHDGVIISHYSDVTKDSHKRLPWSEIVWQTYRTHLKMVFPDGVATTQLQYVIIHKIDNEGTIKLMDEIAVQQGETIGEEIEWYTWDEKEPFFIALMGTDPVQQVARMMIDHNVALGRRTISEIWTHGLSRSAKRERDIWVKIDAYVPPPPTDPGHLVAGASR
ncbi:MAG: hypothetical protein Q9205_006803 [Flavoplaca limonia]